MAQSFRTHTCGELRSGDVDGRVMLAGWVHRRRDHGQVTFFDLRDRYGITQVVTSADAQPAAHEAARDVRNEWVVQVEGVVRHRPEGTVNAELGTGEVEVAGRLRDAGLRVRPDGSSRKLGRQLESAAKAGARFAVIVGPDRASVILRDLLKGEQSEVALDELAARVRS